MTVLVLVNLALRVNEYYQAWETIRSFGRQHDSDVLVLGPLDGKRLTDDRSGESDIGPCRHLGEVLNQLEKSGQNMVSLSESRMSVGFTRIGALGW